MSDRTARQLVLVVGVGRSGTSLLTGMLGRLGYHVPQPEVQADDTNPHGFGEPRWVVDFHRRLLRERRITINDSRPAAWESTSAAADVAAVRAELRGWLAGQLQEADRLVVKDPRTVWFLPLWRRCADELGLAAPSVTMLRHPAEVVASAIKSYGTWQTGSSRTAAWLNVALETERLTRGTPRAFVRYEDLLADWQRELRRTGELIGASLEPTPEVDALVDPTLHRNRVRWEELDVAPRVRDLAEEVWGLLQPLAGPDGGDAAALDHARAAFGDMYAEAEAIAQSSVTAVKRRGGGRKGGPPSLRVRIARRVPAGVRRRLRRS